MSASLPKTANMQNQANIEEHHKKNQEINATKTDVRDDVFTTTPTNAEVKSGTMLGGKAELLGSNPGSIDKKIDSELDPKEPTEGPTEEAAHVESGSATGPGPASMA